MDERPNKRPYTDNLDVQITPFGLGSLYVIQLVFKLMNSKLKPYLKVPWLVDFKDNSSLHLINRLDE